MSAVADTAAARPRARWRGGGDVGRVPAMLRRRAGLWRCPAATAAGRARDAWRAAMALGPLLPLAAMAAGLLFPGLAGLAFQALPAILLATLVCGLLAMPALRLDGPTLRTALALTLALGLVAPLLGWGIAAAAGAGADARAWVALASAAPVGTGALGAALAGGLAGAGAAAAVLVSVLAAPLVLPAVAAALGPAIAVAPGPLALALAATTAAPALVAAGLRRVPALATRRSRRAFADLAIVALAALALARMDGVRAAAEADPAGALALLGLALVPTLAGLLAVLLVLRRRADVEALLAGGFRNVALVWAATAPALPPEGNLLMALTALPVFAAPALARAVAARRERAGRVLPRRGRVAAALLAALLVAPPPAVGAAVSAGGGPLWDRADVEADARAALAFALAEGTVEALATFPHDPGPGASGYAVCGTVRRGGEHLGFAVVYVATEESVGFVRAAGPVVRPAEAWLAAANGQIAGLCRAGRAPADRAHAAVDDTRHRAR